MHPSLLFLKFSWFLRHIVLNLLLLFRSSHQRCSVRKGVLRNFAKFTGKHLRQGLFFNFIKKETLTQVFFCDFCEIFKNNFLTEHLRSTATYFFKLQANFDDTCRRKVKPGFPRYCKQTNLKDVYSWNKIRSLKGY